MSDEAIENDNTQPWSGRRLAREIAIQLLYECDLNPERMTEDPTDYIQRHLTAEPAGSVSYTHLTLPTILLV